MAFCQLVSELDLTSTALQGMSPQRLRLWQRTLKECKNEFRQRKTSTNVLKNALRSINSLAEKRTASHHSPGALATYRYLGEGQLRAVLSMGYEDLLPFDWSLNWSAATMQEMVIRLNSLLSPITTKRRSRILRHVPVSLVAAIMDSIVSNGVNNLEWWRHIDNLKIVMKKTKRMAKSPRDSNLSDDFRKCVFASVLLFSDALFHLRCHLDKKDLYFFEEDGVKLFERYVMKRYQEDDKLTCPVQVTQDNTIRMLENIHTLSPVLAIDFGQFISTQHKFLDLARESVIPNICRNEVRTRQNDQGKTVSGAVPYISADQILLDIVYMFSDIIKCIKNLSCASNEKHVAHLMTVLAEPWEHKKRVNHRKLFMLALALMKGIDTDNLDISLLVQGIMEKLDDNGDFIQGRKPRPRLNARQGKRGPTLQPRVILVTLDDDSQSSSQSDSDGDTSRKKISKRVTNKDGRRSKALSRSTSGEENESGEWKDGQEQDSEVEETNDGDNLPADSSDREETGAEESHPRHSASSDSDDPNTMAPQMPHDGQNRDVVVKRVSTGVSTKESNLQLTPRRVVKRRLEILEEFGLDSSPENRENENAKKRVKPSTGNKGSIRTDEASKASQENCSASDVVVPTRSSSRIRQKQRNGH